MWGKIKQHTQHTYVPPVMDKKKSEKYVFFIFKTFEHLMPKMREIGKNQPQINKHSVENLCF